MYHPSSLLPLCLSTTQLANAYARLVATDPSRANQLGYIQL